MANQVKRHPILVFLLVILTAFCILGTSFRLILLPQVTAFIAERTVNDQLSALSHDQLVAVAERGRAFVAGDPGATMPEGADERIAFTPGVVNHMEDVQVVIQRAFIVTILAGIVLLGLLIYAGIKAGRRQIAAGFFAGGITAVALTLALVVFGALNFDSLFTSIHKLFFADGTWTFAEDSLLICAYPIQFWIGMGVAWALALLLLSVIVTAVGLLLRPRKTPSS